MQTIVYFLLTKKNHFGKKTKPCLQNMTLNINLSVYGVRIFISEHLQSMIINAQTKSKADQMNYLHQTDTINYLPVTQTNLHFVLRKQNHILSQTREQKKLGQDYLLTFPIYYSWYLSEHGWHWLVSLVVAFSEFLSLKCQCQQSIKTNVSSWRSLIDASHVNYYLPKRQSTGDIGSCSTLSPLASRLLDWWSCSRW